MKPFYSEMKYLNRFGRDSFRTTNVAYNGGTLTQNWRTLYVLNSANKPVEIKEQKWDPAGNKWMDYWRDSFVYSNAVIIQALQEEIEDDKVVAGYRYEKTYANGKLTDSTYFHFYDLDTFKGYARSIKVLFTYANDNLVMQEVKAGFNNPMKTVQIINYDYDSLNYLARKIIHRFDMEGKYLDTQKDTFIYAPSSILSVKPMQRPEAKLYPVPASERLFISLEKTTGRVEIEIVEMSGRVVLKSAADVGELKARGIDVAGLSPGIYLLRMESGNGLVSKRFLKR
jgi:hypothetical protein